MSWSGTSGANFNLCNLSKHLKLPHMNGDFTDARRGEDDEPERQTLKAAL